MFDSVLIANRGEIACRIIRTCRRLGIRTVAVYSEADAGALHVALADESHCIGAAEAVRSYLRPEAIVAAALAHRAAAIHPGYGFLSERLELAELCAAKGIAWIGPAPRCIAVMGSKIESKRVAADHGVPSVPGYHGDERSPGRLLAEAQKIGFPVLIKASAGGGGRGMRRVDDPSGFLDELTTAQAEAMAAFGDDRVLLEKFIVRPRHLEVQLVGDKHGGLIHLFERECSIQRNYQKLVEEAPAANLPAGVRARLLEAALRLGRAIGYDSVGTVEFIVEADGSEPYFLEMNTRLQVEHPVTEMITGLDLVELQLRSAAGERLPLSQDEVSEHGSAIELRLNAEDPSAGFAPRLGRVTQYREPAGAGLRVDSGVRAGSEVTPFYDSLLLKLIAHGPDRAAAVRRLDGALQQLVVLGVGTNQAFLRDIIGRPAFASVLTTQFIAEEFPAGWNAPSTRAELLGVAALAMARQCLADQAASGLTAPGPWSKPTGFRVGARAGVAAHYRMQVQPPQQDMATVDVVATADGLRAMLDGALLEVPDGLAALHVGESSVDLVCDGAPMVIGAVSLLQAMGRKQTRAQTAGADVLAAMPGLVAKVLVERGQAVQRGDVVIVQEAMKLMLPLTAPMAGTVRALHCAAGQIVAAGTLLVEVEPAAEAE